MLNSQDSPFYLFICYKALQPYNKLLQKQLEILVSDCYENGLLKIPFQEQSQEQLICQQFFQ